MSIIGITGGTGFVGRHLAGLLVSKGYEVVIFTRDVTKKSIKPSLSYSLFDAAKGTIDGKAIAEVDAIVHLAGANVAGKRWTGNYKNEIRNSRAKDTKFLADTILESASNCKTFISASGIGYYGPDNGNTPFKEDDAPYNDFLGETCVLWENASLPLEGHLRRVVLRIGLVMGKESGAFPQFRQPINFGVMPVFGTGKQVMSWIHVNDLASLMLYAIEHSNISGTFNAVSPDPMSQKDLMKTISKVSGRWAMPIYVPSFVLKIMLGEMSSEILKSCTASAEKTLGTGFKFQYPELEQAVKDLMRH